MKRNNLKTINFIRDNEIFIISAVVAVMLVLLSYLFLIPNINQANIISRERDVLKKKITDLKSKQAALGSLDEKQFSENLKKMNVILPDNKNFVGLFDTFDLLEKENNVSIRNTSFQLGSVSTNSARMIQKMGNPAYEVPVSLGIIGRFEAVQNFVSALRSLKVRLIAVDNFGIKYLENGDIELNLQGKSFYYPYPSSIGGVTAQLVKMDKNQQILFDEISRLPLYENQDNGLENISMGKKDLFK